MIPLQDFKEKIRQGQGNVQERQPGPWPHGGWGPGDVAWPLGTERALGASEVQSAVGADANRNQSGTETRQRPVRHIYVQGGREARGRRKPSYRQILCLLSREQCGDSGLKPRTPHGPHRAFSNSAATRSSPPTRPLRTLPSDAFGGDLLI